MYFISLLFLSTFTSALNLPKTWSKLTSPFKNKARNWFIERAETLGIPWNELTKKYQTYNVFTELSKSKYELTNNYLEYPDYYLKPFHGYDEGNLNWLAAQEGEAATLNIAAGYWPDADVHEAQNWMRKNTTQFIQDYLYSYSVADINNILPNSPSNIVDIGCSIGISTEYIEDAFPNASVTGVDMSPYFLAVAQYRGNEHESKISYLHANAEKLPFDKNSIDIITCNYLFHEIPFKPTKIILNNIYETLQYNGIIAITDVEPEIVNKNKNGFLSPFRKWMFEITEPHIISYYENDMKDLLERAGFCNIVKSRNDPVNSVWIGMKH
jgi:ubiquinone/menaquinone biosynthesis C-methylase UbiE